MDKDLSRLLSNPNPDIEKIDVTDHADLERFVLN
jgi:hypothetical protein